MPVSRLISVVLPAPLGPTMPILSPRFIFGAEVAHDRHAAIALGDAPRLDHLPAGLARLLQRQLHVA